MVNLQDIFKEYERYNKNNKEKNKQRLIASLFILFKCPVKIIESCQECEFGEVTDISDKPLFCSKTQEFLDERALLVGYKHEDCPFKTFDEYLKVMDELREPGELLDPQQNM